MVDELIDRCNVLQAALSESLKLQKYYAVLLNQYDGGERKTFDSVESWVARLRETGALPK